MMIFNIAVKDLLILLKDKKALIIMIIMPLVIMIILGNALGFIFEDELNVDRFRVALVNDDAGGGFSELLISDVLEGEAGRYFDVLSVDAGEAEELLEGDSVKAVVKIPENFSSDIENRQAVRLVLQADEFESVELRIVAGILEGFSSKISTVFAGTNATLTSYYTYLDAEGEEREPGFDPRNVMMDLLVELGERPLEFGNFQHSELRFISSIQYYAATILIMFILFGAGMGSGLLIDERELMTMQRILTTGGSRSTLIMGKFTGICLVTFFQSLVLILFAHFVYKVNWGSSLTGLIILTLCSVFAGSAVGMFIAGVTRTQRAATAIAQLIIHSFNILGGGMVPLRLMPEVIQKMGKISINWWAIDGYHSMMMGYGLDRILIPCLVLLGMGCVYLTIGIVGFKTE